MKTKNLVNKDTIYLIILFVVAFALWSLPATTSEYPYGEGDAAHQCGEADWRAIEDTAQREYPEHLARWYGPNQENYYAPGNAAPFGINSAMVQILSGERFLPKTLFLIFIGIIPLIFIIFLLMKELFDSEAAFVSSFFLIFSLRDILAHLMGQRLIIFSLAYVPAALYCYYKYTKSFIEEKEKLQYLLLTGILAATGALMHPQMLGIIFASVLFYTVYLTIKYKKLPFSIAWAAITVIIALIILLPFAPDWFTQSQAQPGNIGIKDLGTLFKWFPHGPSFDLVGGWWLITLFILGTLFLLINHKDRDIFLLCWLTGLYCMLHLNIFGIYEARINRFLYGTAHIVYPVVVISFYYIAQFINRKHIKYVLYSILLILVISTNGVQAYKHLSTAYPPIMRMTDAQYDAAEYIRQNLPEDSIIYAIGTMTYPKQRWTNMFSHRSFEVNHPQEGDGVIFENATHILVDYSDMALVGYDPAQLIYWTEQNNLTNGMYITNTVVLYER